MKIMVSAALSILLLAIPVMAAEGVIDVQSDFTAAATADRLEKVLLSKGMTIFNRIKNSEGAAKVGIELRDTELIIFGNPKVGSSLMQCQQSVAIDLPLKALVWEDAGKKIWISYNDPGFLQQRHDIAGCEQVLDKMAAALDGMTKAAARQ
ncbi:MAG: hypothetical protein C0619_07215 [Desulfuromonas sp.]|nr:MAG: hypothetical protein C0619_07215 [Desulfuromonas sp.]